MRLASPAILFFLAAQLAVASSDSRERSAVEEQSLGETTQKRRPSPIHKGASADLAPAADIAKSPAVEAASTQDGPIEEIVEQPSPDVGLLASLAGQGSTQAMGRSAPDLFYGTYRHTIPLEVPSGPGGTAIALALEYSGVAANDTAGVGWTLSLPSIQRDDSRSASFSGTSYVYRNGHLAQRLVGTATNEFRLETDPYDQRFMIVVDSAGGISWRVTSRDGAVRDFGVEEADRDAAASDRVFRWNISSEKDPANRYTRYQYLRDGNVSRLRLVAYGLSSVTLPGGSTCPTIPAGCLAIDWEPRPDPEVRFFDGDAFTESLRLASMSAFSRRQLHWQYKLSYGAPSAATGRSLLRQVERASWRGLRRVLVAIDYSDTVPAFASSRVQTEGGGFRPVTSLFQDFDADGRTDVATTWDDLVEAWRVYPKAAVDWKASSPKDWKLGPGGRYYWEFILTVKRNGQVVKRIHHRTYMPIPWASVTGDFDGNGTEDIAYASGNTTGRWYMFLSTRTGWRSDGETWDNGPDGTAWNFSTGKDFALSYLCRTAPLDDSPTTDLACYNEFDARWYIGLSDGHTWTTTQWTGPQPPAGTRVRDWFDGCFLADLNGDRRSDVICRRSASNLWDVGLSDGKAWAMQTWADPVGSRTDVCMPGHFNDDQMIDLVCTRSGAQLQTLLSTGHSWAPQPVSPGPASAGQGNCTAADVTGDGRDDLVCRQNDTGRYTISAAQGTGFTNPVVVDLAGMGHSIAPFTCTLGRYSGTAAAGILCNSTAPQEQWLVGVTPSYPDSLIRMVGEHGAEVAVEYTTSADGLHQAMPAARKILARVKLDSKAGRTMEVNYAFEGGAYDPSNREFAGFSHVTESTGLLRRDVFFFQGDAQGNSADVSFATARYRGLVRRIELADESTGQAVEESFSYLTSSGPAPFFVPLVERSASTRECGGCPLQAQQLDYHAYRADSGRPAASLINYQVFATEPTLVLNDYGPSTLVIGQYTLVLCPTAGAGCSMDPTQNGVIPRLVAVTSGAVRAAIDSSKGLRLVRATTYSYEPRDGCNPSSGRAQEPWPTLAERWSGIGARKEAHRQGFDAIGNLVCQTVASGGIRRLSYDEEGVLPMVVSEPIGGDTRFAYFDGSTADGGPGQLRSVWARGSERVAARYNDDGRVSRLLYPSGLARTYSYAKGVNEPLVVTIDTTTGEHWELGADAFATIVRETRVDGAGRGLTTRRRYDTAGRDIEAQVLDAQTGTLVRREEWRRDAFGRVVEYIDPNGARWQYCHTALSQTVRDPNGHVKNTERSWFGAVMEVLEYDAVVPDCSSAPTAPPVRTTFARNSLGDLLSISDPRGERVTVDHDLLGRAVTVREPGLGAFTLAYDDRGYLVSTRTPDGKGTDQEYDALGRVIAKYSVSSRGRRKLVAYTYDDAKQFGRVIRSTDRFGTTTFSYTVQGQLKSMAHVRQQGLLSHQRWTTDFEWDIEGHLASVRYPTGAKATYQYDMGAIRAVALDGRAVFEVVERAPSGQATTVHLGNGSVESRSYDPVGRIQRIERRPTTGPARVYEYDHDPVGNLVRTRVDGVTTLQATYDGLDRMVEVTDRAGRRTVSYDPAGNITNVSGVGLYVGGTSASGVHPHATTRAGQTDVAYDRRGNAVSIAAASASTAPGGEAVHIVSTAQATDLLWDADGHLHDLRRGIEQRTYVGDFAQCVGRRCQIRVPGPEGLIADQDSHTGELWFGHTDPVGTLVTVSDPQGRLSPDSAYDAAGRGRDAQTLRREESWSRGVGGLRPVPDEPFGVAGQRLYSKKIGRFLGPDSIVPSGTDPQLLNRYAYARNNPLRFSDADGQQYSDGPGGWLSLDYGYGYGYGDSFYSANFDDQMFFQDAESRFGTSGMVSNYSGLMDMAPALTMPELGGVSGAAAPPSYTGLSATQVESNVRVIGHYANGQGWAGPSLEQLVSFKTRVESGGAWDYKYGLPKRSLQRLVGETAGNFNYGAVGASMGLSLDLVLKAAGAYNVWSNLGKNEYRGSLLRMELGVPFMQAPYGDDIVDQYWIIRGYQYYWQNRNKFPRSYLQ